MSDYLLFAAAFMASAITPGADTFLIAIKALESKIAAIWTAAGITVAKVSMVTLIYFGLSAVLENAAWLLLLLKILGVSFLLYRAWVLWHKAPGENPKKTTDKAFLAGFTIGFSNPQPFAFYLSVIPAVLTGTQIWGLLSIVAIGFGVVSALYIFATVPLAAWLRSGKNQIAVNKIMSVVFVLLALWIALR